MKKRLQLLTLLAALITVATVFSSYTRQATYPPYRFPYQKAGLSEQEAAAHLLSRFSFGARPGEIEAVSRMGLEQWFAGQLDAAFPDDSLNKALEALPALKLSNTEIVHTYPKPGLVLRKAIKEGSVDKDSARAAGKKEYRDQLRDYMKDNGMRPQAELIRDLISQKLLRAAYSQNQLKEVLTDFWFNHFNVSLTKGEGRQFVLAYERDAIRPHVLGKFEDLLMATAKSPAMLTYLDNFRSMGADENENPQQQKRQQRLMKTLEKRQARDTMMQKMDVVEKLKKARKAQGLNENYAREIMELHTLGVDGGYTQSDVTQAARVLTGWTIFPMGEYGGGVNKLLEQVGEERMRKRGFVREGDFLFAANKHDKGEKKVLGVVYPAGGGYEEGVKLIQMLARHTSTAKFISKKLAIRFVSDNPPQSLIDKMAKTFLEKGGDIREVLITMATAPEFWSKTALREKTKSPFELAMSSVRTLNARIVAPYPLYTWITRMGQQLYYYQAPTGFPDRGQYWINTGSLLNRMNFGLALASNRIPGVQVDLTALNHHQEPESSEHALVVYSKLLLPGRNTDETVKRLQPMLQDPELANKVEAAAQKNKAPGQVVMDDNGDEDEMMSEGTKKKNSKLVNGKPGKKAGVKRNGANSMVLAAGTNSMISQVVGIILGSPEFQRK